MSIQTKDIEDLLTTTYSSIPKGSFIDIAQEITHYIVMPYLLTQRGGLIEKKGGVGVEETLMTHYGGDSKWVGEYDEDTINVLDHLKRMKVDYCLLQDGIAHTKGEIIDNTGEERINNVILPRRRAMYMRVCGTLEKSFFANPDANNDKIPWGLKYWLVKNATAGFNGGLPSGFTTVAGINLTEVPNFKNYTDSYTNISKTDLIKKMKRATRATNFVAPRKDAGFKGDAMPNKRVYLTNENVIEVLEDLAEAQNDNLGNDLAPKTAGGGMGVRLNGDGEVVFKRNSFVYCPLLDDDTSDPIYGIDMSTFHALAKKGDNMALGDFRQAPNQSRVFKAVLYHRHQFLCSNRRNDFVIAKF